MLMEISITEAGDVELFLASIKELKAREILILKVPRGVTVSEEVKREMKVGEI